MQNQQATMLYVDDHARSSRLLTAILQECGFEVIMTNDPIGAIGFCQKYCFDLALVVYEMPTMSGARLAEELKFLAPDVPIVLLSGRMDIPKSDLVFVDAHFGPHTTLDDLLAKLRELGNVRTAAPTSSRLTTSWSDAT